MFSSLTIWAAFSIASFCWIVAPCEKKDKHREIFGLWKGFTIHLPAECIWFKWTSRQTPLSMCCSSSHSMVKILAIKRPAFSDERREKLWESCCITLTSRGLNPPRQKKKEKRKRLTRSAAIKVDRKLLLMLMLSGSRHVIKAIPAVIKRTILWAAALIRDSSGSKAKSWKNNYRLTFIATSLSPFPTQWHVGQHRKNKPARSSKTFLCIHHELEKMTEGQRYVSYSMR